MKTKRKKKQKRSGQWRLVLALFAAVLLFVMVANSMGFDFQRTVRTVVDALPKSNH